MLDRYSLIPLSTALWVAVAALSGCRPPERTAVELHITASDFAFQMPDSIAAGLVHITLHNAGGDLHEAALERFTDSVGTAAAFVDSIRADVKFPSNAEDIGGAALTLPGDSSGVWVRLTPGRYAVVCWKGDHMRRGMFRDLRVVASRGAAPDPPRATRELTLVDYAFVFDTPLVAGRNLLHVHNAGREPHEGDIYPVTPTAGLKELRAWLDAGEHGLPPVAPVGGFGDLWPGREAWIALDLAPGHYFILCDVPGMKDDVSHYRRGMIIEFSVPPQPATAP